MIGDRLVEERRDPLVLTTSRARIDRDGVLAMLRASHWGGGMTRDILDRAIDNSLCAGVYDGPHQLGFARAVTDLATYAYFTDVIVRDDARGRGIGVWLVDALVRHPDLQGLRRIALWTRDARGLYERFGFTTEMPASTYMERRQAPPYR